MRSERAPLQSLPYRSVLHLALKQIKMILSVIPGAPSPGPFPRRGDGCVWLTGLSHRFTIGERVGRAALSRLRGHFCLRQRAQIPSYMT